jgi:hypothetical protein
MKKRYIYSLLFGIPGFFLAVLISFVVFGVTAGFFWLYVFGDDAWPPATEGILLGLFVLTFLGVWVSLILVGFSVGKRLENEKDPSMTKWHILLSSGLTLLFIFVIVLQQVSVGNLGPQSEGALCSDFCLRQGYSASGMPPTDSGDRTCSCYDDFGNEVRKIPLDEID